MIHKIFCFARESNFFLSPAFVGSNPSYRGLFFILWLASAFIGTCYTLTWDLKMDWGLLERNLSENTLLREEIVYPYKVRTLDLAGTPCGEV